MFQVLKSLFNGFPPDSSNSMSTDRPATPTVEAVDNTDVTGNINETESQEKLHTPLEEKANSAESAAHFDIGFKETLVTNLVAAKEWSACALRKAVKTTEEVAKQVTERAKTVDVDSLVDPILEKTPVLREFQKAQSEFEAKQHQSDCGLDVHNQLYADTSLPPWHPDVSRIDDPIAVAQLRERILSLSAQKSTFLLAPPAEAHFEWTTTRSLAMMGVAKILLNEDPKLASVRFQLVPKKIKEDLFWRNYFYRVFLIRQSAQLSALANTPIDDGLPVGANDFVCVGDPDVDWVSPSGQVDQADPLQADLLVESPSLKPESQTKPQHKSSSRSTGAKRKHGQRSTASERAKQNLSVGNDQSGQQTESKTEAKPKQNLTPEEEELEAELSREVDELVLTEVGGAILAGHSGQLIGSSGGGDLSGASSPSSPDAMDRELELEILAELEKEQASK